MTDRKKWTAERVRERFTDVLEPPKHVKQPAVGRLNLSRIAAALEERELEIVDRINLYESIAEENEKLDNENARLRKDYEIACSSRLKAMEEREGWKRNFRECDAERSNVTRENARLRKRVEELEHHLNVGCCAFNCEMEGKHHACKLHAALAAKEAEIERLKQWDKVWRDRVEQAERERDELRSDFNFISIGMRNALYGNSPNQHYKAPEVVFEDITTLRQRAERACGCQKHPDIEEMTIVCDYHQALKVRAERAESERDKHYKSYLVERKRAAISDEATRRWRKRAEKAEEEVLEFPQVRQKGRQRDADEIQRLTGLVEKLVKTARNAEGWISTLNCKLGWTDGDDSYAYQRDKTQRSESVRDAEGVGGE